MSDFRASFDKVGELVKQVLPFARRYAKMMASGETRCFNNYIDMDDGEELLKMTDELEAALASQTPTPPAVTDALKLDTVNSMGAGASRGSLRDERFESAPCRDSESIPESGPTSETGSIPAGAAKFSELVAPIECLVAYHEKEAHDHVSSQWIYGNHMMAAKAYKKVLQMIAKRAAG